MLFLFIWIIVGGMLLPVQHEVISLYDCEISIISNLVHCFIYLFSIWYVYCFCFWISVAGICVAVLQEVIALYDCKIINFVYQVHWFIFTCLYLYVFLI